MPQIGWTPPTVRWSQPSIRTPRVADDTVQQLGHIDVDGEHTLYGSQIAATKFEHDGRRYLVVAVSEADSSGGRRVIRRVIDADGIEQLAAWLTGGS